MGLKFIIKNFMSVEIYLGTVSDTKEKALGKWSSFYNELSNL